MMNNLETLLRELGCKTPAGEIPSGQFDIIAGFLKTEIEYRRQHRIKRLLRLSGIKHVKKALISSTGISIRKSARKTS